MKTISEKIIVSFLVAFIVMNATSYIKENKIGQPLPSDKFWGGVALGTIISFIGLLLLSENKQIKS